MDVARAHSAVSETQGGSQISPHALSRKPRDARPIAFLSLGYRPFFLLGGIWAALAMALWVALLSGTLALPTAFAPVSWHAHELLYGFLPAVIAGFLLTAVPNWTERAPLTGVPLALFAALWIAGRAAVACSAWIGGLASAAIDVAFLAALATLIGREIVAARDWEDAGVVVLLVVLALGNATFHAEALHETTSYGLRVAIATAVALIMLIGGRIVPAFTRNWLADRESGRLPVPFGRFDGVAIGAAVIALAAWVLYPAHVATGALCTCCAVLHAARLARWAGERTGTERLVLILHVGYAFVPIGFACVAISAFAPGVLALTTALHAWTTGAIGTMTLAVMTRATLGHSGRALHATAATSGLYAAVIVAAIARVASGIAAASPRLLDVAAGAWILAFGGFAALYARTLTAPRPDARPLTP